MSGPPVTAWKRVRLLLFATGWGGNHIAPLLLVYRQRLGLDPAAPQLLLGAYALGLVPGLLLAGPLSDRRGAAYGIAMTAGLSAVQRLARPDARSGITGLYYVLTYLGFAVPYLLALVCRAVAPPTALAAGAGLTLLVALALPWTPGPVAKT